MDAIAQSMFSWGFVVVQLLGLLSMAAGRLRVGARALRCWQLLFFVCLFGVGVFTMLALGDRNGNWLSSATTLSLMAVGAVVDLGRTSAPAII